MLKGQQEMNFEQYNSLYSLLIPKDHELRQINEMVDFSFIYNELMESYSLNEGRASIDPVILFKYLLLKSIYDLSDIDVVKRTLYDLSFKYFLGLSPEETNLIHPSTLTKFRKLRLKDMNLLDLLIHKSIDIAISKGVLSSKTIIVDATHTRSRFNKKSAYDILQSRAKQLRKSIYAVCPDVKNELPTKIISGVLEDEIAYCESLVSYVKQKSDLIAFPKVQEKLNYLEETIEDDIEQLQLSNDEDARIGHKTADSSFFGYKTHIAMSEERLITSAIVTTGEKPDGKLLVELIEKSEDAGMVIEEVIGDSAYSGKENLKYAQDQNLRLISKLNPTISQGQRKKGSEYEFNKDAGMFICPAGHIAIRKGRQGRKNSSKNQVTTYFFDVEKCKVCPQRKGCYKENSKSKSYSVSIRSDLHQEQMEFENSPYFKERSKQRYMIESKNSELKHRHGYDVAIASGLISMQMQAAATIFIVNLKRITKLMDMKK